MNRQDAENIITEYVKPIFGFTLKRCKTIHDAEDLSQEIVLKAFRALLIRDDVTDAGKFIWTVAHNALSNYYRDTAKNAIGVSLDDDGMADLIADPSMEEDEDGRGEALCRLRQEIAYLSKLQRRIVIAYYFENRKQSEIADELGIPLGTVKWHLFEAKKELRRGMNTMREASELKFNPIKFHSYGINGNVGAKSPETFFRSALSQNICYCVRNTAKTVAQIADDLGVSPVYVESEVEFLEEYGFLRQQGDRYMINFIINEPTAKLLTVQNDMYRRAAELFVRELYGELTESRILDDPAILCHQCDGPVSLTETHRADHNYLLWSLIPYIAAWSGEHLMEENIKFEEVATIRPDGGYNIYHAAVIPEHMELPEDYVYMNNWCGPMWNGNGECSLWQIDSEWSYRGAEHQGMQYSSDARRVLSLYARESAGGALSPDEYAWLAERGYIKVSGTTDGHFKSAWQIVILTDADIKNRLLAIGDRIKEKYQDEFDRLKAPYLEAALNAVPQHLRRIREYELQFVFHSDGWFLLHCIRALLRDGKLALPTEAQKKSLMTLIFPN